jgi:hypothetical protein
LDRIHHLEVEIFGFRMEIYDGTTDVVERILGCVTVDEEDSPPKAPMWLNDQETLAQRDEKHNVQDGVWCDLMQLHDVNEQQPTMGRERDRETLIEEGKKTYLESYIQAWNGLVAGDPNLRHLGEEPGLP